MRFQSETMLAVVFFLSLLCARRTSAAAAKPNVLLLYVDDLRVNDDGTEVMPHQDALRARGVSFSQARAMYPMCGPSRNALLSGLRPDSTQTWGNTNCNVRRVLGDAVVTLPQAFRQAGYTTVSLGKVFHPGCGTDDAQSWSEPAWSPPFDKPHSNSWVAVNSSVDEYNTTYLPDGMIAARANTTLEQLQAQAQAQAQVQATRPFFLAVGFHRPHLPFIFPARFLDLYPAAEVPLARTPNAPRHSPTVAEFEYGTLKNNYADVVAMCNATNQCDCYRGPMPAPFARELRRAYHAAASWTDELIGGVLAKLSALELTANTVVVYVSDHGWKLGSHASWEKQTLWEDDLRTPFVISAPGGTGRGRLATAVPVRQGVHVAAPVEHIDLAPTLAELCDLPGTTTAAAGWEGKSLVPFLWADEGSAGAGRVANRSGHGGSHGHQGTQARGDTTTKNATFAQVVRSSSAAQMPKGWPRGAQAMGSSITVQRGDGSPGWKYTEWPLWAANSSGCFSRDWETLAGAELYDLAADALENVSVANYSGTTAVVGELRAQLRAHFAAQLPCPPAPSPSPGPGCAARARADCGQFTANYTACHKCMFQHEGDLINHGCDWSQHGKYVHALCNASASNVSPQRVRQVS